MELLGVIIIITLLTTIAILGVTKIVKSSKEELSKTQMESIKVAAEIWGEENIDELPNNGKCIYITLDTLKKYSFLDDNILDFMTNDKISDDLKIKISTTKNKFNNINHIYEVDVDDTEVENCNMFKINMLVTGQEFNSKIKTLVNGSEKTHADSDTIVTNIKFYSHGILPLNYTKETLTALNGTDVSVDGDNSIMAYYDGNGSIYVYSENNIYANFDCDSMFQFFTNLTNLDLTYLDTSVTTIMTGMFYKLNSLKILDVSTLNTKNVTDMSYMFQSCVNLTEINISNWDTRNVENMLGLFLECNNLKTLDLTNWNTKKVTTMIAMFQNTTNLTCIKVGKNWQVAEAVDDMFTGSGTSTITTDECIVTTN